MDGVTPLITRLPALEVDWQTLLTVNLPVLLLVIIGVPLVLAGYMRVLSPAFGGLYTYAAPNTSQGTASGQVSAKKLRGVYRAGKFSRDARIYGVIADPVGHSKLPQPARLGRKIAPRSNGHFLCFCTEAFVAADCI